METGSLSESGKGGKEMVMGPESAWIRTGRMGRGVPVAAETAAEGYLTMVKEGRGAGTSSDRERNQVAVSTVIGAM